MSEFPLLTRRQAIELIHAELGVPVPLSRFEKDAMAGAAPKPSAVYGRQHLYTRDQILEYGRSLIDPVDAPQLSQIGTS